MFSVACDKDIKPTSIKEGEKIYMNVEHFLPMARFLPKKPGEKGQNKGQRGGARGGRGGRGAGKGGFRPGRGGNSGGYRPPRGGQKQ